MQQGLGWNTSNVEAGSSKVFLLDQADCSAQLCGPDRSNIATRATAYDSNARIFQPIVFCL